MSSFDKRSDRDATINVQTDLLQFLLVLSLCLVTSIAITSFFCAERDSLSHTFLELASAFMAFSIFIIIWYTNKKNMMAENIIGFGFLSALIFNCLHVYFYLLNPFTPLFKNNSIDFSLRFWLLTRFVEAITILMSSLKLTNHKINRYTLLYMTVFSSLIISVIVYNFSKSAAYLFTPEGLTPIKIFLEYAIIFISIITLIILNSSLSSYYVWIRRYIFLAVCITIPSELCFTIYTKTGTFISAFGHVLRIAYYIYLFKAIYVSTISYEQEKVLEKHDIMKSALDRMLAGLILLDEHQRVSIVNRMALELSASSEEELIGKPIDELIIDFSVTQVSNQNIEKMDADTIHLSQQNIFNFRDKNNREFKLKTLTQYIGKNTFIILWDFEKEQRLEYLQLQTHSVLDIISNLVLIMDEEDRILVCNKAFTEITGIQSDQVLGISLDRALKLAHIKRNEIMIDTNNTEKLHSEIKLTTVDGIDKELLIGDVLIKNSMGDKIGRIWTASDITELKQEQQKLIHQEKLALLGQMGASIVHETKNYLATIKGSSQLLMLIAQDEQVKKYAHKIDLSTNEINRIISEFLSLSKPHHAVMHQISFNRLLEEMRTMLETSSLMKGVDVTILAEKEEGLVYCDQSQIKQVILNFAKNAVEAMLGVAHPILDIQTRINDTRDEMLITITDNGKGIKPEDKSQLGKAFFTTKETGTGLGLNVCYQIIKNHGGKISVESELGKGTTFTISFPCYQSSQVGKEVE